MRAGAFFLYYHHPPYYFFRTIAPCAIAPCTIALRTIAPCVFEPSPLVVFGLARSVLAWFDVLGKPLMFSENHLVFLFIARLELPFLASFFVWLILCVFEPSPLSRSLFVAILHGGFPYFVPCVLYDLFA